ncbi:MAG: hypothetical protein PHI98_01485 [Eubacteriales bacterium]|nr:hypothetical protein [Eubacteriales bacterium]
MNPKIENMIQNTIYNPEIRVEARRITRRGLAIALVIVAFCCAVALAVTNLSPHEDVMVCGQEETTVLIESNAPIPTEGVTPVPNPTAIPEKSIAILNGVDVQTDGLQSKISYGGERLAYEISFTNPYDRTLFVSWTPVLDAMLTQVIVAVEPPDIIRVNPGEIVTAKAVYYLPGTIEETAKMGERIVILSNASVYAEEELFTPDRPEYTSQQQRFQDAFSHMKMIVAGDRLVLPDSVAEKNPGMTALEYYENEFPGSWVSDQSITASQLCEYQETPDLPYRNGSPLAESELNGVALRLCAVEAGENVIYTLVDCVFSTEAERAAAYENSALFRSDLGIAREYQIFSSYHWYNQTGGTWEDEEGFHLLAIIFGLWDEELQDEDLLFVNAYDDTDIAELRAKLSLLKAVEATPMNPSVTAVPKGTVYPLGTLSTEGWALAENVVDLSQFRLEISTELTNTTDQPMLLSWEPILDGKLELHGQSPQKERNVYWLTPGEAAKPDQTFYLEPCLMDTAEIGMRVYSYEAEALYVEDNLYAKGEAGYDAQQRRFDAAYYDGKQPIVAGGMLVLPDNVSKNQYNHDESPLEIYKSLGWLYSAGGEEGIKTVQVGDYLKSMVKDSEPLAQAQVYGGSLKLLSAEVTEQTMHLLFDLSFNSAEERNAVAELDRFTLFTTLERNLNPLQSYSSQMMMTDEADGFHILKTVYMFTGGTEAFAGDGQDTLIVKPSYRKDGKMYMDDEAGMTWPIQLGRNNPS